MSDWPIGMTNFIGVTLHGLTIFFFIVIIGIILVGTVFWVSVDSQGNFKPYRLLKIPFFIGLCYLIGRVFT